MQARGEAKDVNDPAQVKIREAIEAITGAADQLRKYSLSPYV